ncbi:AAA family ATPase [Phytomonospora sp. NPDC050363]|uniref:AAA family ATPase n=1 Tax=Phytomonospora sp. NPDC050363 TaxID=3155642 RepID=UPI0033EDE267
MSQDRARASGLVLPNAIVSAGLLVLIGAAGAGKSTLAAAWPARQVLSLDAFREMVSDDPCDQDATAAALAALEAVLVARLAMRRRCVVDATNTTREERAWLLAAADATGTAAAALVLRTPLAECLARNALRPGPLPGREFGRRVPEEVLRRQFTAVAALTGAGLRDEGFAAAVAATPAATGWSVDMAPTPLPTASAPAA